MAHLDYRPEVIQFGSALTEADYALLGEWLKRHPTKTLRAYASYDGTITDVDFLRHFPFLRSFHADALNSLANIDRLGYLPEDVEFIGFGQTKKRLSLAPLARVHPAPTALPRSSVERHRGDQRSRRTSQRHPALDNAARPLAPRGIAKAPCSRFEARRDEESRPLAGTSGSRIPRTVDGERAFGLGAHTECVIPTATGSRRHGSSAARGVCSYCRTPQTRVASRRAGSKRKNDAVKQMIDLPSDGGWQQPLDTRSTRICRRKGVRRPESLRRKPPPSATAHLLPCSQQAE